MLDYAAPDPMPPRMTDAGVLGLRQEIVGLSNRQLRLQLTLLQEVPLMRAPGTLGHQRWQLLVEEGARRLQEGRL